MGPRSAIAALALVHLIPTIAFAQDADNDGAPDAADARPCDPTIAGLAYAPAEGQHGLLLLEDHWPSLQSDEDFNDVAVAYNFVYTLDASGRVTRVQATLSPLAAGGGFAMGLGLHLPIPRGSVQSVTLSTAGGAAVALTPSADDAELTVVLAPDIAALFGDAERPINSTAGTARAPGQPLLVDVRLSSSVPLFAASAPHDLYIFHTATPSHEIHRPQYPGTAAMNPGLFGQDEDGSTPGNWFVDTNRLPSALLLPFGTVYPRETVGVGQLFPRIASWAASGGTVDADFYLNDTVAAQAYRDSSGSASITPATPPSTVRDVSCVAVERPINTNTTINDANVASFRGTRWTVGAGVTVTIGTTQPIELHSLDLAGTITTSPCTTSACGAIDLRVAGDATIRSSGVIDADGRGYRGSFQNGNGSVGRGYGNTASGASAFTGGSHGGFGGMSSGVVAPSYGDFLHPVLPGGGGTSNNSTDPSYAGGNGGGVIRLTCGGRLTIDGRIRANGSRGGQYDTGGAGGSIWLAGAQVASSAAVNTVLVQADGAYGYYSGGGGGRVAVYGAPVGNFNPQVSARAQGGVGANYGSGGSGTVAYGVDEAGRQSLHLTSPSGLNSNYSNTRVGAFGAITAVTANTLTTSAWLQPGLLVGRTLVADAEGTQTFTIASNTTNTIIISGTGLNNATAVGRGFCVQEHDLTDVTVAVDMDADLGCITASGTLRAQDATTLDVYRAVANRYEVRNTAVASGYDITGVTTELRDSARLVVRALRGASGTFTGSSVVTGWGATTARFFPVSIAFDTLGIGSSALVTVDSLGYLGSITSGSASAARTNGNVSAGASAFTGGSHGGYGGISSGTPAALYGDVYQPIMPGSGGTSNNTTDATYAGGNGGGVIRVDVSGTFTLDGRLTANGGRGGQYDTGGAGGSIWVTAGTLSRSVAGVGVQANGGYGYYSGGGGGRVALHYGALGGTWSVTAASVQANGGTGANYGSGGSGTILYRAGAEENGRLLLSAPSGLVSNYGRTRLGAFGAITSLSANLITTSAPLEPGTLAGRRIRPDASQALELTVAANTSNTITVAEGGLTSVTAVGRVFAVADRHTAFDELIVEGAMSVDLGRATITNGLTVRGAAQLDYNEITAATLDARDTSRLYGRAITAGGLTTRNSARITTQRIDAGTLAMTESSVITGWAPTTSAIYPLTLAATTLSVGSAARVTVDGLGYLGSIASGSASSARTLGNVSAGASAFTGGSHGGYGGMSSGTPALPFGDIYQPTTAGSGGTSNNTTDTLYMGGNGGGVIRIDVAGVLTQDGLVTANGARGGQYDTGGAGGSIWVTAGTIARTTTGLGFQASGAYGYYSGGGGGRIALHYGALGGTWAIDTASVQAYGGTGANYGSGGSGTVLHRRTGTEANGRLLLSGSLVSNYARTRIGAFGAITSLSGSVLTTSAHLELNSLAGRTLRPDVEQAATFTVLSNTANTITVAEAGLTSATAVGRVFAVVDRHTLFDDVIVEGNATADFGRLESTGALTVRGAAQADFSEIDAATVDLRDTTRSYGRSLTAGALTVGNTARLTTRQIAAGTLAMTGSSVITGWAPTNGVTYSLGIAAQSMSMTASTLIHTDALGYIGSIWSGSNSGRTFGNALSGASAFTGGSHGGYGGMSSGTVAAVYGDALRPTLPGGGGTSNNTTDTTYAGGNGGGVIRVVVDNTLTLDGRISASGGRGGQYDCGGAGGSVWIDAGTIQRSSAGFAVEANGATGYYSGGGGGRVALHYGALSGWNVSSTTVRANGGAPLNYGSGGSGTVVSWPRAQARPNLLINASGGANSNFARTRVGTFGTVTGINGLLLTTGTVLQPNALVGRTLVPFAEDEGQTFTIVANTASSITANGSLTGLTAVGATWYVRDDNSQFADVTVQGDADVAAGSLDVTGALVLEGTAELSVTNADIADLTVRGTSTRLDARRVSGTTLRLGGASVTTLRTLAGNTVTLGDTALLTGPLASTTAYWPISVSANDLTVGASARISADNLGFLGSYQRGNGNRGRTNGNVAGTADFFTGGSYGGRGGASGAGNALAVYGSSTQPNVPGGGGTSNNSTDATYAGGSGGGVIRIQVANRFGLDGVVSANGGRGGQYDCGGAGGSVWVTAGTMASGNGTGRFEANGAYGYYSGGGGGRVAVQAGATAGWVSSATTLRATGGTGANYGSGAVGTTVFSSL